VSAWPSISLAEWGDTYATLHRWSQIVGKIRLALATPINHWWHVVFYVTSRGLTTSPMPYRDRTLQIDFDFVDHDLTMTTNDGETRTIALAPRTVADFYRDVMAALSDLDVAVRIWPMPVEIPDPIVPFPEDREHGTYDAALANRFWRALVQADRVLTGFRGRYLGKASPSHFFWGGFDLAVTRFSGRTAPPHPGGIPNVGDFVAREGYSHELSSAGLWPGGGAIEEAMFYAYAYPEPTGFRDARVEPAGAYYHPELREFVLPYEAVRRSDDPDHELLAFLQSTYQAAADLGGWDRAALER
jgi:hypothetical protein